MKHFAALVVILSVVAAGHWSIRTAQARKGAEPLGDSVLRVPDMIGDYRQVGADHEISDHVKRVLGTSSILIRDYAAPSGSRVQLTIVHAGATRRSLHFPEVCLVGAGWEIREQTMSQVGILFSAKQLVLVSGEHTQAVLYWFKTGDRMTGNFFVNAYYWAVNQLTMGTPTSSMIKLSAMVPPGMPEERVFEALHDFAVRFAPVLQDYVP